MGLFVAEGSKIVGEIVANKPSSLELVLATPAWVSANKSLAEQVSKVVCVASEVQLAQASQLKTPQGVLALVRLNAVPTPPSRQELKGLNLFLDGIQDPSNLGAILRVADWFAAKTVFLGEGCADAFGAKAIQASMGAFLRVPVASVPSNNDFLKTVKVPILGAFMEGYNIFNTAFQEDILLIIGNEGNGISEEVAHYVNHRVTIPRFEGGGAESLNAAVAAGIICARLRGCI